MTEQYLREASLVIGADDGHALDLSELRFRFTVRQQELGSPNSADIRVYNPAPATVQRAKKEFTKVILQAGYQGASAIIFQGSIIQTRYGREDQVNTFLDFTAADGDQAHNFAVANTTLAAGYTNKDANAALCTAMNPHGVTQGYAPDLGGPRYPRGRVFYGMARDHLRDLAEATGTHWNINGGKSQLVPAADYLPDQAVVVNSATGMIGLPIQTQDGVVVRMLLNPRLKAGVKMKIDNASIQTARLDPSYAGAANFEVSVPKLDADGDYRILAVDHTGDTRGRPWYSDVVAIGKSAVSLAQVQRGRV